MTDKESIPVLPKEEQFVLITRVFDASRDLVFKAWTDPAHLTRWYAPQGCTIRFMEFDFRRGGVFRHCISDSPKRGCWAKGVFKEIVVPELLVYTLGITDEEGNAVQPADVGMDPDWPRETLVKVIFQEEGGKTKVTLHQTALLSVAKRTGAYPSWLQMFDRLAEVLIGR
jgi:uncharacterized protein YndB with AHSA1/START domain